MPDMRLLLPVLAFAMHTAASAQSWTPSRSGGDETTRPNSEIGDAAAGRAAFDAFGCGTCHRIRGRAKAQGLVGPPLDSMGRRVYIAGALRNTPENMVTWLRFPHEVEPGTAMPDLGLSAEQARDITAYLYGLE